jgi:hypothetical protein
MTLCSLVGMYQHFGGPPWRMEVGASRFLQTVGTCLLALHCHIAEDHNLNIHCCENLRFNIRYYIVSKLDWNMNIVGINHVVDQ